MDRLDEKTRPVGCGGRGGGGRDGGGGTRGASGRDLIDEHIESCVSEAVRGGKFYADYSVNLYRRDKSPPRTMIVTAVGLVSTSIERGGWREGER